MFFKVGISGLQLHFQPNTIYNLILVCATALNTFFSLYLSGMQKFYSVLNKPPADHSSSSSQNINPPPATFTPVSDRVCNAEAMLLSFMAEHSLPFSMAPHLITLTQGLSHDKKAFDKLSMDRTTASYKLTHGFSKTFKDQLLQNLRECFFSMNIDEATSKPIRRCFL